MDIPRGHDAGRLAHLEHGAIDALMAEHLDRLLAGELEDAAGSFAALADLLERHLAMEERELFPRLARHPAPRWRVAVYQAEHDRLRLLADRHRARLAQAAREAPADGTAMRRLVLALIDALHPLRHVLEHHQEREAQGLIPETGGPVAGDG